MRKSFYKLLASLLVIMSFSSYSMGKMKVVINNHSFYLEVPQVVEEYNLGLMYRKYLPESHGMIFVFNPENKNQAIMWMKNTYLPLDMLFIGSDYQIKCILEYTQPLSLTLLSCDEATLAVIELNAGEVNKFKLKKGMKLK